MYYGQTTQWSPCRGCGWITCLCNVTTLISNYGHTLVRVSVGGGMSRGDTYTVRARNNWPVSAPSKPLVAYQIWPAGSEAWRVGVLARRERQAPVLCAAPRPWTASRAAYARRLRQRYRRPRRASCATRATP